MAVAEETPGDTIRQSSPLHWWWQTPGSSLKQRGQQGGPRVWWRWAAPIPRRCRRGRWQTWPCYQRESLLPRHHSRPLEHIKLTQHKDTDISAACSRGNSASTRFGLMMCSVHPRCRPGRPLHREKHPIRSQKTLRMQRIICHFPKEGWFPICTNKVEKRRRMKEEIVWKCQWKLKYLGFTRKVNVSLGFTWKHTHTSAHVPRRQ